MKSWRALGERTSFRLRSDIGTRLVAAAESFIDLPVDLFEQLGRERDTVALLALGQRRQESSSAVPLVEERQPARHSSANPRPAVVTLPLAQGRDRSAAWLADLPGDTPPSEAGNEPRRRHRTGAAMVDEEARRTMVHRLRHGATGQGDGTDGYAVRDRETVERFLARHRFLVPVLGEARHSIAAIFGPETPVRLELVTDPEEGDSALFARIETTLPVPAALDRLNRLSDDWWLDALPAAQGFLHIDVE